MIWTISKLREMLLSNNVNILLWGKGMSKTLEHLFFEIVKGECEIEVKNGKVIRTIRALSINVFYKDEILREEYQKMKDGRFRRRKLDCSVAEKITREDKDLNDAVKRALEEELNILDITNDQIKYKRELDRYYESSEDYPGIAMNIKLYKFDTHLKYVQYNPYGYVEHQNDKDIFFVWTKNISNESYNNFKYF